MNAITLPVAELKTALTGLGKIIGRKQTLPVFGTVRVTRDDEGRISLAASNLDSFASVRMDRPDDGAPASLLVPVAELKQSLKACGAKDGITVAATDGNRVAITHPIGEQFAERVVDSFPVREFPAMPEIHGEAVRLESGVRDALLQAMQCASHDEKRYILKGALIDVSRKSGHYVVSTDGRHLYSANTFRLPLAKSVIVPAHPFLAWKPFVSDGEWDLTMDDNGKDETKNLRLQSRRWTFVCREIEGSYPNYRQVVPEASAFKTKVRLTPEAIDTVLGVIQKLPCHDDTNRVVKLVVADGKLALNAHGKFDAKGTTVEVAEAGVEGDPVEVGLNRDFLAKALRFGLGEIGIIDPLSPLRFADDGRQMIVMPCRIAQSTPPEKPGDPRPAANASPTTETTTERDRQSPAPVSTTTNERKPMHTTQQNGAATGRMNGSHATTKAPLDELTEAAEELRETLKGGIQSVSRILVAAKTVARDQKVSAREVNHVRTTLEKLQSVRI